ncbi:type I methionyl aminopeptidase [Actinokineospora globicatena]|uniref:type I methionyl aminopeptidase n=1 Tax=Actinokineospora globicatena TaxID=103729 RepID=UPI0020A446D0|nr:type I methionyl aminopeptidase [Actinokineospora globicatena]MCP2302479.1 methionine aminopeptidase, type I [Actinokineospora globicatena]GLW75837.1 methionine aminopeptidase [Actinokineospora globicatena]GLW82675.1 methionine aminopeptidase [Actinokineospora globicatena]
MIELKTAAEVAAMRVAGRVVATALERVWKAAEVGVTLLELDEVAREVLAEHGAGSSFLDYQPGFAPTPFPAVLCTSVNDAIVHGIPDGTRLRDGDLLSIDFGAHVNGWHGDSARSFVVGTPDPADLLLIETAERALAAAIAVAIPGNRLGDIGHAVATVARGGGYGIPGDFGGHGIGREMHEAPSVPNEARPGRGLRLRPGMVLAIEPMLHAGGDDYTTDPDGWTLRTTDGRRAAHVEHTVAITDDGPQVLTAL